MSFFEVFLLSLIEGLTEFIPISSTGHLVITSALLKMQPNEFTKAFDVIIQFGAILAVVFLYKDRLRWNFEFYQKIFLAFIPTALIGFFLRHQVDEFLESTSVVAWALIIGGIILLFIDRIFVNNRKDEPSLKQSMAIGFFQSLAIIPGVSRSAASIIGGMSMGLTRIKAAEFSFILAIPTMAAATIYKLWKIRDILKNTSYLWDLSLGVILSFIFSIVAIKFFITILNRYGFKYFGIYRIIVGVLILVLHAQGVL